MIDFMHILKCIFLVNVFSVLCYQLNFGRVSPVTLGKFGRVSSVIGLEILVESVLSLLSLETLVCLCIIVLWPVTI